MSATDVIFTGGCYCGEVRYQCVGPQRFKGLCYCRTCQMISGGAGNLFMAVDAQTFQFTKGNPRFFNKKGPSVVSDAALLRDLRSPSYRPLRTRAERCPHQGWHARRAQCIRGSSSGHLDFRNAEVSFATTRCALISGNSTTCSTAKKCLTKLYDREPKERNSSSTPSRPTDPNGHVLLGVPDCLRRRQTELG